MHGDQAMQLPALQPRQSHQVDIRQEPPLLHSRTSSTQTCMSPPLAPASRPLLGAPTLCALLCATSSISHCMRQHHHSPPGLQSVSCFEAHDVQTAEHAVTQSWTTRWTVLQQDPCIEPWLTFLSHYRWLPFLGDAGRHWHVAPCSCYWR